MPPLLQPGIPLSLMSSRLFTFVLILVLTMFVCQLDIGPSTPRVANHSFQDKLITFGRQSVGLKLMASKLLSICMVSLKFKLLEGY